MLSGIDDFLKSHCELVPDGDVPLLKYQATTATAPPTGFDMVAVQEIAIAKTAPNLACYRSDALTVFSRYLNTTTYPQRDIAQFADALMLHPRIFLWGVKEGILTVPPLTPKEYKPLEFWGIKLNPQKPITKPRWRP